MEPLARLHIVLDDPPPVSVNKLYSGRERFLTKAGRRFKDALTEAVARAVTVLDGVETDLGSWKAVVDAVYEQGAHCHLLIRIHFPKLHNRSWKWGGSYTDPKPNPKTGKTPPRKRRSPYQKKDGSNYIKLIEDAVASGTGIDDSANLRVCVEKEEDPNRPRVEVLLTVTE